MANRLFTGTTCGGGTSISFITDDTLILANPINRIYQLGDGTCFTLTTSGLTTSNNPTAVITYGPYTACTLCITPVNSAGVTSIICDTCPNVTGVTITQAPHAIYTNNQGRGISQNNTVTVGGFNGLNN
jgi:hypothetical protein